MSSTRKAKDFLTNQTSMVERLDQYQPYLAHIDLYPIKALDGVSVEAVDVLPSGALRGDRTFAFFDDQGHFVNGKRNAKVHQLRTQFSPDRRRVTIQICNTDQSVTFDLLEERNVLESWLGDYFGFTVHLRQNPATGFPDDTNAPGPTVISTATLETIASWFPELTLPEVRRRFRTNLEIGGVPPFWEDQLFGESKQTIRFQVGQVQFEGVNPCQRCVVPTRDSLTGEAYPSFQKQFIAQREATLPNWVTRSRFNHFYRVAVNTRLAENSAAASIAVGDRVTILSPVQAQSLA